MRYQDQINGHTEFLEECWHMDNLEIMVTGLGLPLQKSCLVPAAHLNTVPPIHLGVLILDIL